MSPATTDPKLLVHAYVDGELDPAHALEMDRQFASDPALAAERERVEALRRAIREQLPLEAAPAALARRIESALDLRREDPRTSSQPSWRALAASVVLAVFLASGATWFASRPDPADTTADMLGFNRPIRRTGRPALIQCALGLFGCRRADVIRR